MFVLGVRGLVRSGVFFGAAAEGPAPDVVSQLLYEFRILLLYLLRKLLPPAGQKQNKLGTSQSQKILAN